MPITNQECIGKAMELLGQGFTPFVEREFKNLYVGRALAEAQRFQGEDRLLANKQLGGGMRLHCSSLCGRPGMTSSAACWGMRNAVSYSMLARETPQATPVQTDLL